MRPSDGHQRRNRLMRLTAPRMICTFLWECPQELGQCDWPRRSRRSFGFCGRVGRGAKILAAVRKHRRNRRQRPYRPARHRQIRGIADVERDHCRSCSIAVSEAAPQNSTEGCCATHAIHASNYRGPAHGRHPFSKLREAHQCPGRSRRSSCAIGSAQPSSALSPAMYPYPVSSLPGACLVASGSILMRSLSSSFRQVRPVVPP